MNLLIDSPLTPESAKHICSLSSKLRLLDGMSKDHLKDAHVIYTLTASFDPSEAPRLRWVQTSSVSANYIMDQPIAKTQIPVATVQGVYTMAVAECAVGALIALMRNFPVAFRSQIAKKWPEDIKTVRGTNCYGRTIGLVGYGSIGRHIARIVHSLGMRILALKRKPSIHVDQRFILPQTGDPDGILPSAWYGPNDLLEMLGQCDVCVITLPITKSTYHIIDATALAALPDHACLVQIGRGGVLDEAALVDALEQNRIRGAALDVFETEPLPPSNPLWECPNMIILPHIGSYTHDQAELAVKVLFENLRRDMSGQELVNVVNFEQGY